MHKRFQFVCTVCGKLGVKIIPIGVYTTGWLRFVGSIKLQVSFAIEPYKTDYSAKETYNLIDPDNHSLPISENRAPKSVYIQEFESFPQFIHKNWEKTYNLIDTDNYSQPMSRSGDKISVYTKI